MTTSLTQTSEQELVLAMSQVSPVVKLSRWSFLLAGMMYGSRKSSEYFLRNCRLLNRG